MNSTQSLKSRVAIITGAGRGIGAETARTLAKAGAKVVINDLDSSCVETVASECEKLGAECMKNNADVSNQVAARALVSETISRFGRVDILVNNAGITRDSMIGKMTEEQWDQIMQVNLKGPFNLSQACFDSMKQNKFGRIVNISSVAALGNIGQTNYSASKAGIIGFTRSLALEGAKYGITCNAIGPGLIDSRLTQSIPEEIKSAFVEKIPLKRIGQPQDIANAIWFLCSEYSSYVTGQTLFVDGGLSVGF